MHKPVMRRERRRKGKEMKRKMMAAVLIMAMTAGVLGGCGNSTGNNAKTDTNAQNNANTAEIKENANADVTEIANADGTVYKVGIVQYVDDASLNQIEKAIEAAKKNEWKNPAGIFSGNVENAIAKVEELKKESGQPPQLSAFLPQR